MTPDYSYNTIEKPAVAEFKDRGIRVQLLKLKKPKKILTLIYENPGNNKYG